MTGSKESTMTKPKKFFLLFLALGFIIVCVNLNTSCKGKEGEKVSEFDQIVKVPDIKERVAQFVPTEITYDESVLKEEQKQVLNKLVLAAKLIDKIFWKQASHVGLEWKARLEQMDNPAAKDYLLYLIINFGPFDRLDENKPFIGADPKPSGAGFYPIDMTKNYFEGYITGNPDVKEAFENSFTVIRKKDDKLIAVPYNEEYKEELEPIAQLLKEAADITSNLSLKKYLNQRAVDLLRNDYYQSDVDWIDLRDNLVEIVIGPYEVYEDALNGYKAAYESFVYINDLDEMKKIEGYLDYLDEMQKSLPVDQKYKDQDVSGLESPLNVVIEVFTAGDTKAGVQTLAFVLPNDERVREEKGTKKVFLKNMMEAKFNKILVPISKKVLTEEDVQHVSFFAYFNETTLHEICHVLGVNYVALPDGSRTTVNRALQENYSAIEESKATVVGIYNVDLLMEKGWIPKEKEREIYTTYLAGMFRSLRFGLHEAHGLSTIIQYNFMRERGAFLYDDETQKYSVDMTKIKGAIKELAQQLLILEGEGDYEQAKAFIEKYRTIEDILEKTIQSLEDIPVDIAPVFN
jgi:hypothetical protein